MIRTLTILFTLITIGVNAQYTETHFKVNAGFEIDRDVYPKVELFAGGKTLDNALHYGVKFGWQGRVREIKNCGECQLSIAFEPWYIIDHYRMRLPLGANMFLDTRIEGILKSAFDEDTLTFALGFGVEVETIDIKLDLIRAWGRRVDGTARVIGGLYIVNNF